MPGFRRPCAFAVVAICGLSAHGAFGQPVSGLDQPADRALEALQDRFAGVRLARGEEGERAAYGRPMTAGASAEKAAHEWLSQHADVFGVDALDLRQTDRRPVGNGPTSVIAYAQFIDGLPVEDGIARVLVQGGARQHVVYASARAARRPLLGFPPERITAEEAVASVRRRAAYQSLTDWSRPSRAIFVEPGDFLRATPVRVWKFQGWRGPREDFAAFTFFVSTATGELVDVRNEVYRIDITGHASGNATPGMLPDNLANPPLPFSLAALEVHSELGPTALTDEAGNYVLANSGVASVLIDAGLAGPWVNVQPVLGDVLGHEQTVIPPGPADIFFNSLPTEFSTSQVNAFLHTNLTREFFKSRQPAFTGLDQQLNCFVNLANTCNAYFTPVGLSINFFQAGEGCANTAYSSVIAHEFGHFIVNRHNLPQGAFGEGYADCVSLLMHDDPVVGREFFANGVPVRDIVAANQQYPCFGEEHDCGRVLGGVWWDLKLNLQATMGSEEGLDYARQLFTDWTEITIGGRLRNSAHPLTAVEVLTVDDDDADVSNGTPHAEEICDAFASHSIPCPGTCDDVSRVRVSCRGGSTVRATVISSFEQGTELTLTLDEGAPQTALVNRRGRAAASWSNVPAGSHEICLQDCPGVCRTVSCTP